MSSYNSNNKRSIDQVDNELLTLAVQQTEQNEQNDLNQRKKRRRQYAPMTQYSNNTNTQSGSPLQTKKSKTVSDSSNTNSNSDLDFQCPSGYIKKIILKNFMCHENFEMDFGPRLNFIVGNNGSGKSAILTTITVGLGAKASETNRGNSLKDLIRNGCYSTKITIILDNSSYGSYQMGTFGKEIIIERVIKRDGPASFSLKTENGKEISHKKKDIQAVIDYFSIPISNPMCFLSQDNARSFLTASTPQDKYMHFMKGTLLHDLSVNLEHAKKICINANENMSLHLENLKFLKKDYEDAKTLVKELHQTSNLNEMKRLLQAKSCWIDIKYNEKSVLKRKNDIQLYKEKLDDIESSTNKKREKIERYESDNKLDSKDIEAKNNEWEIKDQKHQQVKDQLRAVRRSYDITKENINEAEMKIKECNDRINGLDKSIQHLKDELKKRMNDNKEQMRLEHTRLTDENKELAELLGNLSSEIQELENKERNLLGRRNEEIKQLETAIKRNQHELRKIKDGNISFLSSFDPRMEVLLKQIQANKTYFRKVPMGPLGNYVTVKDYYREWAPSIQRYLSSTLNSFVVCCSEDNRILRTLIRNCGIKANISIITYRFEHFNIEATKPQTEFLTIIDSLEFSKPELKFLFVDINRIEQVLLIKDHNKARNFLRTKPKNVVMILSQNLSNSNFGFQLVGGYRLDSVSYEQRPKLKMGSLSDNGISYIQDQITDATNQIKRIRIEYNDKIKHYQKEINELKRQSKKNNYKIQENSKQITKLRINLEKTEDTGVLTSKENEKEKQKEAISGYQTAIESLKVELNKLKEQAIPIKNNYDETKNELDQTNTIIQQLNEKIEIRHRKIRKHRDDIALFTDKKLQYSDAIERIKNNIKTLQDGIEVQKENALKFASEEELTGHDLPNDQEQIKEELNKIARKIRNAEKQIGMTQVEVLNHFESVRNQYKESYAKYKSIDEALVLLQQSIENRWQNYHHLKNHTCLEADMDFRKSIRIRNFSGNLLFIEDSKSLEIYILTPNDEKVRNVDTLSGGEKSFSQMALLLATWKPMRSRIIALDEFDVFMDQVNRKTGTALIVKKLKDSTRTQTIIITPQDIGKIADIDKTGVKIHKMRDPQRHNNSNFYSK